MNTLIKRGYDIQGFILCPSDYEKLNEELSQWNNIHNKGHLKYYCGLPLLCSEMPNERWDKSFVMTVGSEFDLRGFRKNTNPSF